MKFTQDASKFEFDEDVEKRTITLVTHEARTVFYFPKDYDEDAFLKTYDFLLDFSVSAMPKAMGEISAQIPGACIMSELKPGLVYDDRHTPEFFLNRKGQKVNRDRWSDGLTFEEWCSDEQIAKEFYSRPQATRKHKQREEEIDERPTLDDDWQAPVREERKFTYEPKPKSNTDKSLGDLLDGIL